MSTSQVMLEITTNQDELADGIKTLRAYRIQMQTLCKHHVDIAWVLNGKPPGCLSHISAEIQLSLS
jgi:hypothetical protein